MKPLPRLSPERISRFRRTVYAYYRRHKRPMPWRDVDDPYRVLVSEIMLQQTQVPRVRVKYPEFIAAFPTLTALAQASLREVLSAWQGMGYNRRALLLKQLAETVVRDLRGEIPYAEEALRRLPGIGPYTAAAMRAFAFDKPAIVLETNIRSVFIDTFFRRRTKVHDREIIPLVQQTLDTRRPRQWYYALMDYGAMLKDTKSNPGRKSSHHLRQSRFEGSDRQIRGNILRALVNAPRMSAAELIQTVSADRGRAEKILNKLIREHLVAQQNGWVCVRETGIQGRIGQK